MTDPAPPSGTPWLATLRREVDEAAREAAIAALTASGGNIAAAARALGLSRGGLIARLKRWGLYAPPGGNSAS